MNQVFLSPNVSMRGAGGGYYDYLDFLDVVAPALARIQQLMQILTSCTTAEAFHAAHEREKIRMNFSFTMSDREMRRRRGTWSRVLRDELGRSKHKDWLRGWDGDDVTTRFDSERDLMTAQELHATMLDVNGRIDALTLDLVARQSAAVPEIAAILKLNTSEAHTRAGVGTVLEMMINGDYRMVVAVVRHFRSNVLDAICEHNHSARSCILCASVRRGICEHNRRRNVCKDCGGGGICQHNRQRNHCKLCGVVCLCEHNRQRNLCKL